MYEHRNVIFVIIPVHNRIDFTIGCLEAMEKQTYSNFELVLIDDGSIDGTTETIQKKYKEVSILSGDGNYWWTKSVNEGIKYAMNQGAKYVITLNNDTIPESNFVEMMVKWSKVKPEAIFGALEMNSDDKPIYGGHLEKWATENEVFLVDILSKDKYIGLHKSDTLPGRGLWLPVSVFSKIGLFDQKNFFTVYSIRHCPFVYLFPRLIFGYYYRTFGYWKK